MLFCLPHWRFVWMESSQTWLKFMLDDLDLISLKGVFQREQCPQVSLQWATSSAPATPISFWRGERAFRAAIRQCHSVCSVGVHCILLENCTYFPVRAGVIRGGFWWLWCRCCLPLALPSLEQAITGIIGRTCWLAQYWGWPLLTWLICSTIPNSPIRNHIHHCGSWNVKMRTRLTILSSVFIRPNQPLLYRKL